MKQAVFSGIVLLLFSFTSFSQANTAYRFGTTGSNVIAYKQGTSCTASAYTFYMINDAGVQAATPFYTIANTSREANGIGINPIDRFLYGIEYDRDASCAFSNFHLKRYDNQGNSDDLEMLPAPAGGSLTAALGCVTNNGNFIYSTKDASNNSYVSVIGNIASLPANADGTLTLVTSKQIINNASNYSYADWAVHPSNGNIYTYGIANIGGVSTGKMLVLDPNTGILQSSGATDVTNFLDATRDNFGGVYFGADGLLYGVNVNTRKLYRINPISGVATAVTTLTGSGQIRADMGSYTTGWIILPVKFTEVAIDKKGEAAVLRWSVANASDVKEFVVEQNTGAGFTDLQTVWVIDDSREEFKAHLSSNAAQYRVRAVANDGKFVYSSVVYSSATKQQVNAQLLINPVRDGAVRFVSSLSGSVGYNLMNSGGQIVKSGTVVCAKGGVDTVNVASLRSGVYLLQLNGLTTLRFVVE